jgi:hypothetical protein
MAIILNGDAGIVNRDRSGREAQILRKKTAVRQKSRREPNRLPKSQKQNSGRSPR